MMKKLLALLLALLLPVAALADASRLDITITVNEANYQDVIKASGVFAGNAQEDKLCAALAGLLNGIRVSFLTQDDAVRLEIAFDDEMLLDLSVLMGGEDVIITSDMMEGYGLTVPKAAFDPGNDRFLRMMADTDWFALAGGMLNSAMEKLDGVEKTTTRGSFTGNAFTGGVWCDTYTFDDAQVAAFMDGLLTDDLRSLAMDVAAYWQLDGNAILESFTTKNAQVAVENVHRYVVRFVYNEQHDLVGVSATVLKGEQQLATLSLGVGADSLRLVVGFGLDEDNYWHDQTLTWSMAETDDGMTTYTIKGSIDEFTSPKVNDFSYARLITTDVRMQSSYTAELMTQEAGLSWRVESNERMGDSAPLNKTEVHGICIPGKRLVNTEEYSTDGKEIMTENIVWAAGDPQIVGTSGEGLTLVSMLDADEATINGIALPFGLELGQRLMKVIPMELLMYLQ